MSNAPWGECMRCGFKRHLDRLRVEWTGLRVCADTCWDPRPADTKPVDVKPEGVPVAGASPQTDPIFIEDADPEELEL